MPTSTTSSAGRFASSYSTYSSYPSYRNSSYLTSSYLSSRPISLDRSSYISSRSSSGSSGSSSYRYSSGSKSLAAPRVQPRPIYSSVTDSYRSSRSLRTSPSRSSYSRLLSDSYYIPDHRDSTSIYYSSYKAPRALSKSRDSGYDSQYTSRERSGSYYDNDNNNNSSSSRRGSLVRREDHDDDDDRSRYYGGGDRVRAYENWKDLTEERLVQRRKRLGLSPARESWSSSSRSRKASECDDDDEERTTTPPSVSELCRRYRSNLNVANGNNEHLHTVSSGCSGGSGSLATKGLSAEFRKTSPSTDGAVKPSRSRLNSYNEEGDEAASPSTNATWKGSTSSSSRRSPRPKSPVQKDSTEKLKNSSYSSSENDSSSKSYLSSSLSGEVPRYRDRKDRLRERIAQRLSNELENNDSSSPQYGERDSKSKGLTGLRNIGNTCFMNSILQCLSNTRCLLEYIIQDNYSSDINSTLSTMKGSLVKAFASLLKEMWTSGGSTSPVNTGSFKGQIQRFAPVFMGYAQHDAQEFLRKLLEGLHEDVNRVTMKPKPLLEDIDEALDDNQKAMEAWKRYIRLDDSKIVDMFVGQLKSSLQCSLCGHISVTFDPFWDLSLPIPQRSGQVKLSQCIDLFTKEEVLDGDERPTCSNCKERRKMTKSFSIQKFPKVLVLHLKRFSPHERWRGKLTCMVDFPLDDLDLSRYAACSSICSQYRLISVANHSGTALSGHYTAYCRHPYLQKWHEYNDSRVSTINPNRVCSVEAYVLFYELNS